MKLVVSKKFLLTAISLLSISAGFFLVLNLVPRINYDEPLQAVTRQELMILAITSYEHDFLVLGVSLLIISVGLSKFRMHKKSLAITVTICAALYLNYLYLWTSHALQYPFDLYGLEIIGFWVHVFQFLGITIPTFPVDITSILILASVFFVVYYGYGIDRAIQITCLVLLPLPLDVYLFDPGQFNIFVISDFARPVLSGITNAVVLYLDLIVLAGSTVIAILKNRPVIKK